MKTKILFALICLFILLPVTAPLFTSYVPGTADGLAHKFRLVGFDKALTEGIIRPRWLSTQALRFGAPVFLFIYLLPYYMIDGMHRAGFDINTSTQIFEALTLTASFSAMYLLVKRLWGRRAGLAAGAMYVWAPYHLLTVYLYEGWGEMLAFVFPPLVLYFLLKLDDALHDEEVLDNKTFALLIKGYSQRVLPLVTLLLRRVRRRQQKGYLTRVTHAISDNAKLVNTKKLRAARLHFILLTFSWMMLLLSHNVTALIFSPVLIVLSIVLVRMRVRSHLASINAFVAAVVLSSFFWLPAVFLNRYTLYPNLIIKEMGMRGSYFKSLSTLVSVGFSTVKNGTAYYLDFTIGLPLFIVAILSFVYLVYQGKKYILSRKNSAGKTPPFHYQFPISKDIQLFFVLLFTFVMSVYLANYASNWIWNFQFLNYIVYPFRFLLLATFAGSIIAGFFARKNIVLAVLMVLLAMLSGRPYTNPYVDVFPYTDSYFQQVQTVSHPPGTLKSMATVEFLPRWADLHFLENEEKNYLAAQKIPDKFVLSDQSGKIIKQSIKTEDLAVTAVMEKPDQLLVNTFYFPNWKAFLDGAAVGIERDNVGRMLIMVPSGIHEVRLTFALSAIEQTANSISFLGLVILLLELAFMRMLFFKRAIQNRHPQDKK